MGIRVVVDNLASRFALNESIYPRVWVLQIYHILDDSFKIGVRMSEASACS